MTYTAEKSIRSLILPFELKFVPDRLVASPELQLPWEPRRMQQSDLITTIETIQRFPAARVVFIFLDRFSENNLSKEDMDKAEERVVEFVEDSLRVEQLKCSSQHSAQCGCHGRALPQIKCLLSFDQLKDDLGAEVFRVDGSRVSHHSSKCIPCS